MTTTNGHPDPHASAMGFPVALAPYVFGADAKRRLLFLTSWPEAPDHVVTLAMLKPEQAARVGGSWTVRVLERFDDGSALGLWDWLPDAEPEAAP